jgi:anaphase-promoting complex subunit 2
MSKEELNERKKRVFDWVFGQSKSQPRTTPAPRFIPPSQNSGGPLTNFTHDRNESNQHIDQVLWDRSWRTVTENLALPDYPSHLDPIQSWNPEMKTAGAGFSEALQDLLSPQTRLPRATYTEDIIAWYTSQVRHHFMRQVLPILPELQDEIAPQVLYKTITILETVHRLYLNRLSMILEDVTSMRHLSSPRIMRRFHRDLHAVISNLVTPKIAASLQTVLKWNVSTILGLPSERDQRKRQMFVPTAETRTTARVRDELLRMIESLRNVGLAGEKFQIMFAEIMNDLMTDYVLLGCEGIWSDPRAQKRRNGRRTPASTNDRQESILPRTAQHASPSKCVRELCEWIENRYAKLVVQVFQVLDGTEVKHAKGPLIQVEKWKEISIGHLASLRTNELFDIILKWPHSSAALDDLRTAITTPQRRLQLTNVFAQTLNERLLHPGASTLQILQTYISMISSFHALDHSKVLLDRVAYPLQLYLCSREDTVRIIITGLLSDAEDLQRNPVGSGGEKLVELASLLNEDEEQLGQKANDEELDWHDPDWLPDPVDAGPGYKRSKNADVIGTLIGVLGSQDVFIKEFQNIIAEHLLKNDGGFEREASQYQPVRLIQPLIHTR